MGLFSHLFRDTPYDKVYISYGYPEGFSGIRSANSIPIILTYGTWHNEPIKWQPINFSSPTAGGPSVNVISHHIIDCVPFETNALNNVILELQEENSESRLSDYGFPTSKALANHYMSESFQYLEEHYQRRPSKVSELGGRCEYALTKTGGAFAGNNELWYVAKTQDGKLVANELEILNSVGNPFSMRVPAMPGAMTAVRVMATIRLSNSEYETFLKVIDQQADDILHYLLQ